MQKTGDSFIGIVNRSSTIPGGVGLVACVFEVGSTVGNASITGTVDMISRGRSARWDHIDQTIGTGAAADAHRLASKKAVHDAIPNKATGSGLNSSNDGEYLTPAGFSTMETNAAIGKRWSLTWDSDGGVLGANLSTGEIAQEPSHAYQYNIKSSDADEEDMDTRFHENAPIRLETDASNYVEGVIDWAAHDHANNLFSFAVKSTGRTNAGTLSGTVRVTAEGALRGQLKGDQAIFYDSISAGDNVTISDYDEDNNRFTISATGGSGGTFASRSQAENATNSVTIMSPLRTEQWFTKKVTVGQFSTSDGFQLASSSGSIPARSVLVRERERDAARRRDSRRLGGGYVWPAVAPRRPARSLLHQQRRVDLRPHERGGDRTRRIDWRRRCGQATRNSDSRSTSTERRLARLPQRARGP